MNQVTRALRSGAWLGLTWGAVEWAAQGWAAPPALDLVVAELVTSTLAWALIALVLGWLLRRSSRPVVAFRGALLGAFFFCGANLLIHPYLLAGVRILTLQGLLFSLGLAAVFLPLPGLLLRVPRVRPAETAPAAAAWTVPALLLGLGFVLGREILAAWPAGWGRVLAGVGLLAALQALSLLAFVLPRRAMTPIGIATILLLISPLRGWLGEWEHRPPPGTAPRNSPPVLLISLDTTRWDHVSAFGYPRPTTPNLDRFLETSRVFPRAYATSSWTLPSHGSVFTGKYPLSHGAEFRPGAAVGEPPQWLTPEVTTLAETFRDRGYPTAAISANRIAISPGLGLDRGFQFVRADLRAPNRPIPANLLRAAGRLLPWPGLKRLAREHWDGDETTRYALEWIEDHAETPFFLFVNYIDPHAPYAPPLPLSLIEGDTGFLDRLRWNFSTDRNHEAKIDAYDGELRHMDSAFGRLMEGLEHLGIADRALVVVFSDHGEFLGEFGMWGHNKDLHEALLRAVLAVRYPGGTLAGTDSTLVNLADIPRLIGEGEVGRPELPEFNMRNGPWIAGEKNLTVSEMKRARRWSHASRLVAARLDRYKLIQTSNSAALFDLLADPGEATDIASQFPAITRRLQDFVREWHEETPIASHGGETRSRDETRDLLRSLGYMQ